MKQLFVIILIFLFSFSIFGQDEKVEKTTKSAAPQQKPKLNNLKHPDWNMPIKLGSLGTVSQVKYL
jgi:hypothetical protein